MNRFVSISQKLRVDIVHPGQLTVEDVESWRTLIEGHTDYHSPLLSPDFAILMGKTREDARVALFRDADGLACVFAFFARPDRRGRPIGAPFADYSGPILRSDVDVGLSEIIAAAGLAYWRTEALVDPWNRFTAERGLQQVSQVIHLDKDPDEYLETCRKAHAKRFKNFRRLESQAGRDGHELIFKFGQPESALVETLLRLKSAQYRASGLVDLTSARLSREILDSVAGSENGFAVSLWSGEAFVSGHFGFRTGERFHPWIAAYNPDFSQYSPGNLLLKQIIAHMPEMGLSVYDLAEGHDHYKKYYTNASRNIYAADVQIAENVGVVSRIGRSLWSIAVERNTGGAVQRLQRRVDHISACDDRMSARFGDLLWAVRKRGLRQQSEGHQASSQ